MSHNMGQAMLFWSSITPGKASCHS